MPPNALAQETSPYLLQHRDNPVDWRPWGPEALDLARTLERPLLVSIGYSACHWCHVMERESFEDPEVAELMNANFVCVKVDREERPDIDAIYMEAVQGMTGQGGWPLNVFLTPEQLPFYGGTYFPPAPRHGLPSWRHVLGAVADAWVNGRDEVLESTRRIGERLAGAATLRASDRPLSAEALQQAVGVLEQEADPVHGGTAGAPKFPPSCALEFLLARGGERELELALRTLRGMSAGGIHDQVAGGFARYAVDSTWTVPHFEKMLYDNALLARAYLHGWLASGDTALLSVCLHTLEWALSEMRAPEGGFYSALDADSDGVEGAFYVWTLDELRDMLGDDAPAAIEYFGATAEGNFEGANVLRADGPAPPAPVLRRIRSRLLEARARRTRPGLDDKRLTAWNALMVAALAETAAALSAADPVAVEEASAPLVAPPDAATLLDAARACAGFLLERMRDSDGRLLRTYSGERARLRAYLEDHAFLLEALLSLYEATLESRWLVAARELADTILLHFADSERGGFFSTADDHEQLIVRRKELQDAPIPSGPASAAVGLLRLAALTGDDRYATSAGRSLKLLSEIASRHPNSFGKTLRAMDMALNGITEVALVGEPLDEMLAVVRRRMRPNLVLAAGGAPVELLDGRRAIDGRPTAYVCRVFVCEGPVQDAAALAQRIDR